MALAPELVWALWELWTVEPIAKVKVKICPLSPVIVNATAAVNNQLPGRLRTTWTLIPEAGLAEPSGTVTGSPEPLANKFVGP